MGKSSEAFVAFDVAKKKHAVAIAEGGRAGEVRFLGDVENSWLPIERTIKRLADRFDRLHVCFEAGPTGYGLYRRIQALGHDCMVVAPALIPKRAGERIKTNRRDAVTLARLHRAGELTEVWTSDPAMRRCATLCGRVRRRRTTFAANASSFSPSCCGTAGSTAGAAIGRWRIGAGWPIQSSSMPRSRSSFRRASTRSKTRSSDCAVSKTACSHRAGLVYGAHCGSLSGDARRVVSRRRDFAAEIGDVRRFDTPRQLMSFLGLVPAESSTGDTVRRKGLTLAGDRRGGGADRGGLDLPLSGTASAIP